MSHKCLDKELYDDMENSHHHDEDEVDRVYFEDYDPKQDYIKLGQWILQTQDGIINESDFHKLQNCLLTNARARDYYVEFMWVCAGLHQLFSQKQVVIA